jgi:hypothetical protein
MYPKSLVLVNKCKLHKMGIPPMCFVKRKISIQTVCIAVPCASVLSVFDKPRETKKLLVKENTTDKSVTKQE